MSHTRTNRLTDSRDCHEAALAIWRAAGDRYGEAESLNLLGLMHLRLRELSEAEACFQRARTAFGELGFAHWECIALLNLADARHQAGRTEEAARDTEQVLAVYQAMERPGRQPIFTAVRRRCTTSWVTAGTRRWLSRPWPPRVPGTMTAGPAATGRRPCASSTATTTPGRWSCGPACGNRR